MATDFTNGGKTIGSSGGFKPTSKNTPLDSRTVVSLKADINSIPNPFVGMHIVVLQDESKNNEMTEYVVKSLKASSLGVADAKVNEIVLVKDFLGISTSGGDSVDLTEYVTETELNEALSTKANTTDIPSLNGYATETYVMDKLGGKSLVYLTQSEYDVLSDLEKQDITKVYNITDATEEIDYNNIVNKPTIPTKTSELTNDSSFVNETYVSTAIANAQLGGGSGSSVDLSLYATKEEVATSLNTKSDVSHTHVMADITDLNVSGGGGITTVTYDNLSEQLKAIFVVIK